MLVVEGYTDVLGAAQAGVRNVVASMGTALRATTALMTRFSANVTFMFDADRAGSEAACGPASWPAVKGCVPWW